MNLVIPFLRPLVQPFTEFFHRAAAGGIVLLLTSLLALGLANTDIGVARYFPAIWEEHLRIGIGSYGLDMSLLHWINDGLMTVFFLIVGLEIKREVLEGELSSLRQAALPIAGAVGGMVVPALLFFLLNRGTPTAGGWGIPMATDIAFSLAVLNLLGPRVPLGLKVFLTALAIVDDLGAVLVIAGFYTEHLAVMPLGMAAVTWILLMGLNALGVRSLWVFLPLGIVLWGFMLQSGVHATLAGVFLAVAIPFRTAGQRAELLQLLEERLALVRDEAADPTANPRTISEELEALAESISSPAQRLEQRLHGLVAFGIIPLFAFANTSLTVEPAAIKGLLSPLGLGILLGLVVGKPLGIGALCGLMQRLSGAALPKGVTWRHMWGAGVLAGIGFTMSIFITLLALGEQSSVQAVAKIAILLSSLLAGTMGYLLLRSAPPALEKQ